MNFIGIIPARYASTRFPAKPLALLGGKPVIQRVYEQVVDLLPDDAGTGVEDVDKGLILPVDVGDKVLGALGQVQNGLKVDDLAAGGLDRGVLLGQQFQITQLFLRKSLFPLHSIASFKCRKYSVSPLFHIYFRLAREADSFNKKLR